MKRNYYAAYDFIRQGKFRVPEKIRRTEASLKKFNVVINWWCRQSGKTLTNIKVARDWMMENPGSMVLYVSPKGAMASNVIDFLGRSVDKKMIAEQSKLKVVLNNGSKFLSVSASSLSTKSSIEVDLVIFDEFEYIDFESMVHFIRIIKTKNTKLTLTEKLKIFLGLTKKRKPIKAIFSSSMRDGKNFSLIREHLSPVAVIYLNYEALGLQREKLIGLLGPESFEKEYNSYRKP